MNKELGRLVPDSECKQTKCAAPTTGCWDGCALKRAAQGRVFFLVEETPEQRAKRELGFPIEGREP